MQTCQGKILNEKKSLLNYGKRWSEPSLAVTAYATVHFPYLIGFCFCFCFGLSYISRCLWVLSSHPLGLPSSSDSKESACKCRRPGFDPWVGKIPWRRKWQPTLVFLPGESYGQRSLAGYSPWGPKESDATNTNTHILYLFLSHGAYHRPERH